MRKQWLKKEDIYYKPFYKRKAQMYLLGLLLLGIIFIFYQVYTVSQLPQSSLRKNSHEWTIDSALQDFKRRHEKVMQQLGLRQIEKPELYEEQDEDDPSMYNYKGLKVIRGTRVIDFDAYKPNSQGKFTCLDGSKEIDWIQVNDDYCDCLADGSDEPSTNACMNGRFYCFYQKRHITGRGQDLWVPSSRINDNVCDCCDGSDEWDKKLSIRCKVNCI